MRFQNGDSEAALEVMEHFKEFLEGFFMLLRAQEVKRLTPYHRLLLSTFSKSPWISRALRSSRPMSVAVFAEVEKIITSVSIQLRPVEAEDLRHEIYAVFIATIKRYKSLDGRNFLIPYVLKSFPYALSRRVQALIKDPLVNLASDKIISLDIPTTHFGDYSESRSLTFRDQWDKLSSNYEDSRSEVEDSELGASWLRGDTCSSLLDVLTYTERKILRSFYYLQMTDAMIARETGVSYNTAIRRRHHIEAKLRGEYTPPVCKWCQSEIPKAPLGRQPRQCNSCKESRRKDIKKPDDPRRFR